MVNLEFTVSDFDKKNLLEAFSTMPGGIFVYQANESGRLLYANGAVLDTFGCTSVQEFLDLTGGSFSGMVHEKDRVTVESAIWEQIRTHTDRFDHITFRIQTKKGEVKYLEDYGRLVEDEKFGPIFYVFLVEGKAKYLAYEQDELSGFPGMRRFLQYSANMLEMVRSNPQENHYAYVYFNLTNFKRFNASQGFEAGDAALKTMARVLNATFPNNFLSRFSEDHFVVCCEAQDLVERITRVRDEVEAVADGIMKVKAGIYHVTPQDVSSAVDCDLAKYACDFIKNDTKRFYCVYEPGLEKDDAKTAYVLDHLEQAIAEGWIVPFYQPVIRTLSGELCSAEALARWIDPERGLISPADFIPPLEKKGLSYKLDMCIVQRVVSMLQQRILGGQPVMPISVNISRSDFDYCDPVEIIANVCDAHHVRRNLICVEITETALVSDMGLLRDAIERFHKEGFEVWMDDFGSGYSSLNVLKDFDFDEIKIDMGFLRNFNEKSKKIVTAAVRMAKELGIHTLAEGVETQEHVDFLKSIGCERIQGYYYGKPQPVDESIAHLIKNNIALESHERAKMFQKIGLLDVLFKRAFAIISCLNEQFHFLYWNKKFLEELLPAGGSGIAVVENALNHFGVLREEFLNLCNKSEANQKREIGTIVLRNRYYHVSVEWHAAASGEKLFSILVDASAYEEQAKHSQLDKVMRNINSAYDCVYIYDCKKNLRTVYSSVFPNEHSGDVIRGIKDDSNLYRGVIHPDDFERFKNLLDANVILKRLQSSKRGSFSEFIQMKLSNTSGAYVWSEYLLILLPDAEDEFLMCIKPANLDGLERKRTEEKKACSDMEKNLDWLRSFLMFSNLKLFWKDTNRRFLGASQAFLDYYGFESIDAILGKTDEEIGWHLDDSVFETDERNVLEKGSFVQNAPGKNVVDGVARNIFTNKYPLYQDGKIIGLIGYFINAQENTSIDKVDDSAKFYDPETDLMNAGGMMASLMELDNNYRTNGEEYLNVRLTIHGYKELFAEFGKKVATDLLHLSANKLKEYFGQRAILSRTSGSNFNIAIRYTVEPTKILKDVYRYANEMESITDISDKPCSIHVTFGGALGKDGDSVLSVMEICLRRQKLMQRMSGSRDDADSPVVDPFMDIPLPYVVIRPILDPKTGNAVDGKYIFVNQLYCRLTGLSKEELVGNDYLNIFPQTDRSWVEIAYRASNGEILKGKLYDGATHHWLRYTASPAAVPGTCCIVSEIVDA